MGCGADQPNSYKVISDRYLFVNMRRAGIAATAPTPGISLPTTREEIAEVESGERLDGTLLKDLLHTCFSMSRSIARVHAASAWPIRHKS